MLKPYQEVVTLALQLQKAQRELFQMLGEAEAAGEQCSRQCLWSPSLRVCNFEM